MTETKAQQECPYCHEMKVLMGNEDFVECYINGNYLINDPWGESDDSCEISYCPKCGRKLEAEK